MVSVDRESSILSTAAGAGTAKPNAMKVAKVMARRMASCETVSESVQIDDNTESKLTYACKGILALVQLFLQRAC